MPVWFAETFIIDHQNAASWRAQKDRLLEVDSLHTHVAELKKPRFSLASTVGLCLGAAGAGFLAGVVSRE